jgi:hypothetical protein
MSLCSDELSLLNEVCSRATSFGGGAVSRSFLDIESSASPQNRAEEFDAFTGLASFTALAGQTGVTTYGGRVGLNYRIN